MKRNKSWVNDMTSGNELMHLIKFAIPMLVGNLFQQLYNIIDSIIVGRFVGSGALGAVGAVGNLHFLFISICIGLGAGIGILVAQNFGAKNHEYVKRIIGNAFLLTPTVGICMSAISVIFSRDILIWMRTPAGIFEDANIYMKIVCGAMFVAAIDNMVAAILRALGDSKTPLLMGSVACVCNIVLDLVFVVKLEMGVAGVACATVISQVVSATGSITISLRKNEYFKLKRKDFVIMPEVIHKCMRLGIPMAIQSGMIAVSCVALQRVVNQFGEKVVAAFTATSRVEQLVQQPFNSLGLSLSTFAGQNIGAGKQERVTVACKKCAGIVIAFSAMMVVVMHVLGNNIVGVFIQEQEVINIGARGLQITSWMYVGLGLLYIMRGMLNGAGDSTFAMINGICEVIGRIGFSMLLMHVAVVGIYCAWYATGLTWAVTGVINVLRVSSGKWKRISLNRVG